MHLWGLSKVFFSVSNEKVDGGEAVQKKWQEEDLDSEVENVDGVAELRKRTGSKTSSYENNSNVMWCMIQQWIKLLFLLHTFWLFVTVCSIAEYLLYCVLKKGALLMSASNKINYHFHFLKLLLFLNCFFSFVCSKDTGTLALSWKIWPPKMGCRGHFDPQAEFFSWNTGLYMCMHHWIKANNRPWSGVFNDIYPSIFVCKNIMKFNCIELRTNQAQIR